LRPMDAAGATDVEGLSRVFLHVGALDADPERLTLDLDLELAVDRDRLVVLADLVVLRHVRIEVVLPGEPTPRSDLTTQREADPDGVLHRRRVEDRQRARQTEAGRAHLGVRGRAEARGATTEHLRGRAELDVHL